MPCYYLEYTLNIFRASIPSYHSYLSIAAHYGVFSFFSWHISTPISALTFREMCQMSRLSRTFVWDKKTCISHPALLCSGDKDQSWEMLCFGVSELWDTDFLMRSSFCMSASRSVDTLCSQPDKAQGSSGVDGKTEVWTALRFRISPGPVWTGDDKEWDKRHNGIHLHL